MTVTLVSGSYCQETTVQVGGRTRNMLVHAPSGIASNRPLLISMHGLNQDAEYQQNQTKWESIADTAKFVLVYPRAINLSWDISGTSDTDFILAIIDAMHEKYGIDLNRVYLSGFSMGGMLTYHAATKIADKIAAFAPVSGYLMGGPNTNSSRPIPIIHTHGTADDVVGYSGVQRCMDAWVKRNNCPSTAVVTSPYPASNPNRNDTRSYWGPGDDNVEVVLLTLDGKGHWHSNESGRIHTSAEIWKFVSKYSLESGSPQVTIVSPVASDLFTAPAPVALEATASDSDGSVVKVEFYNGSTLLFSDETLPYSYEWVNVEKGSHVVRAVATDNQGNKGESTITVVVNIPQGAYNETAHSIPGKIELEHFDVGGNGFAYYDNTPGSETGVDFRDDEDVDIEECSDAGGGYNLGWTAADEWVEYTVDVADAGIYSFTLRVACNGSGRTLALDVDGKSYDIDVPNTQGWQEWADVVVENIELKAGEQVMRLTVTGEDYVNLNYMTFEAVSVVEPVVFKFKAGWNLIGYPFDDSLDLESSLSSIWEYVEVVKDFDSFYDKSQRSDLNTLKKLEKGYGYFVKVSENCDFQFVSK